MRGFTTDGRQSRLACLAFTFVLATIMSHLAFGHGNNGHGNPGSVRGDGRFTPNVEGAEFPPQQRNISNIQQYTPSSRTQAFQRNLERILGRVVQDNEVQQALGENYVHIRSAPFNLKGNNAANKYRHLFFSYSNNQTVTVLTNGSSIRSLTVEAASENQPALAQSEMDTAIALARNYWLGRGKRLVNDLLGYAIQTFQQDGSPYPTRMVYVSFHSASPEPPELFNWVDLSTGEVVTGEEE